MAEKYPCRKITVNEVFTTLLRRYGPQGWWPILSKRNRGPYDSYGYHPNASKKPERKNIFEVALGAVLTQNTAWRNVITAMERMLETHVFSPEEVLRLREDALAECIRPSGYYNQKAKKLKILASAFIRNSWETNIPSRGELLELWGIGRETADSILLYAYGEPIFVVDAYTKRLFYRLGYIQEATTYDEVRNFTQDSLKRVFGETGIAGVFNEFHALIVYHGKVSCRKVPTCETCILHTSREETP